MSWRERLFDLTIMALLAPFLIIAEPLISILLLMTQGRPVFYLSRRMKSQHQHFSLIKFRTMRACTLNAGVTGGDKFARITPIGRLLRQTRLDELPQALNVLRGDIRLVGPRPPLPCYVRNNPDLYAKVLSAKPGITGLASLLYKDAEARHLAHCTTAEQTHAVYNARCVPRKAAIDLIYQRNRSLLFDLYLILATGAVLFGVKFHGRPYFRRGGPPL